MTGGEASELPIAEGRQTCRAAWRLLRRHPFLLVASVAALLASAVTGLMTPWALGRLIDLAGTGSESIPTVWGLSGAVLAAACVSACSGAVGVVLAARAFETGLADLREQFVERALELPQQNVEQVGVGELVSRASDDVAEVSDVIPAVLPDIASTCFTIAVSLAGMALIDWRLALAPLVALPVHVLAVRWYLRTAPAIYAAERAAAAKRAHHLLTSLRGLDSVLAYRLSGAHVTRIAAAGWQVACWAMHAQRVQNRFFARLNLAEYLGVAALLTTSFLLLRSDTVTIGAVTAAVLMFLRLFGPIGRLLFVLDEAQSAAASLARIIGIVAEPAGPSRASSNRQQVAEAPAVSASAAALESVSFSYAAGGSDTQVLRGLDLRIGEGEHLALVGSSGAGKSTIAMLLAGVHEPQEGRARRPTSTSLLSQRTHVFAGTVAENLRLAAPEASDAQLRGALLRVHATGLLSELAEGLDTRIGQGGRALTPARAQQLALARLVLSDPTLAILDEATAEADSADAEMLDRAAAGAIRGRSALVIAHRLSQAQHCDRIVLLKAGGIAEEGSHEDLLARNGDYAALWRAWRRGR